MILILEIAAIVATVFLSRRLSAARRAVLGSDEVVIQERGSASKERILALMVDNVVAFLLAIAAVRVFPPKGSIVSGLTFSLAYLGYFFVGEAVWGRTPGKLMTGLHVVMLDGRPCSPSAAAIRTVLRIVEVNPIIGALPGGLVVMASGRNQRLGDMLGKTLVVTRKRPSLPTTVAPS